MPDDNEAVALVNSQVMIDDEKVGQNSRQKGTPGIMTPKQFDEYGKLVEDYTSNNKLIDG